MNLSDPLFQFQLTSSICTSVAFASTIYRIYIRRSRFWVDDACSLLAMLALSVQFGTTFSPLTPASGAARYYIMITTFYVIVWTSRFSILFSIIRIDPSKLRKRVLLSGSVAFFLACGFLIAQLYVVCEDQKAWKNVRLPQCELTKQVAITQLAFNTLADLVVLVIPLQLLHVLQDKWLRSRLMLMFSTCMLTTVVSLVHAAFILSSSGPKIIIVALVESSVSVIVCNLPVIATAFLHLGEHAPRLPNSNSGLSDHNGQHSHQRRQMSVQVVSQTPTSQISGAVLLAEPRVDVERGQQRPPLGLTARPSSVLLKPEVDHLPRII